MTSVRGKGIDVVVLPSRVSSTGLAGVVIIMMVVTAVILGNMLRKTLSRGRCVVVVGDLARRT